MNRQKVLSTYVTTCEVMNLSFLCIWSGLVLAFALDLERRVTRLAEPDIIAILLSNERSNGGSLSCEQQQQIRATM